MPLSSPWKNKTYRSRDLPYAGDLRGKLETRIVADGYPDGSYPASSSNEGIREYLSGTQITESENHPYFVRPVKNRATISDLGGPFFSRRRTVSGLNGLNVVLDGVELTGGPGRQRYVSKYTGPMLPISPSLLQFPDDPMSDLSTLQKLGTVAIARCSPTKPAADLALMIHELGKEGLPSLVGTTLRAWKGLSNRGRRKAIGSEYLNVEFGWKPLISDIVKMATAVVDAGDILNQFQRDSGKLVRRRYEFPAVQPDSEVTVLRENVSPWTAPSGGALYDSQTVNKGRIVREYVSSRTVWFSGAFSYYYPELDGSLSTDMVRGVQNARHLLGLSFTPDTLWNAAPWSWAVDWFSNTSETLGNWSAMFIDNQVLVWGYLMEHSIASYTYTFVGPTGFYSSGVRPPSVTLTSESKARIGASPYGFGLNWNDFTSRQLAIVAALGLTHS